MTRVLLVISILLTGGVVVARGQELPTNTITDADKTGIIKSVLKLERGNQNSQYQEGKMNFGLCPTLCGKECGVAAMKIW